MNGNRKIHHADDIRYLPSYSVREAALYLRLPVSTLRAWIGRQKNFESLVLPAQTKPLALSFINLVEAYVLASIRRKHRISMNKARNGMRFISDRFSSEHPLAEKDFETDGISLFLREADIIYDVSQGGGRRVLKEMIEQYLQRIERDPVGLPEKLYPFSRTGEPDEPKLIMIDPQISFGRPVLSARSVPTENIVERYKAGESTRELAKDYECARADIEEAIRCGLWREAA